MKFMTKRIICAKIGRGILAFNLAAILSSASAFAAINYGDFTGTSVSYLGVTESSGTDAGSLFGAPTISGNTLDFNPQGFTAFSSGGGADLTDGQLNFLLRADSGALAGLRFSEAGDFSLAGIGTANTHVTIATTFFFDILKVDGNAIDPVSFSAQMTYTPTGSGQFDLLNNPGIGNIWTGLYTLNLNDVLTANGISFSSGVTEVRVNLDNTLLAVSESGSVAYLAKKDFKGFGITVVPEPSTIAISLFGAALLFGARKKQS